MKLNNILSKIPKDIPQEMFESLVHSNNIKIKRIISKAHSTPTGEWYNQEENEFIIIIKGNAELLFEDDEIIKMKEGDYIIIPAHKKHRVEKTSQKEETVWLAIFYK